MLPYILPSLLSDAMKNTNYDYYKPRTMYKLALILCIHLVTGVEVKDNPIT